VLCVSDVPGSSSSYLDWGFLHDFLFSSREMPGEYLKLGHDHLLPHPLPFMTYYHSTILHWSQDSSVGICDRLWAGWPGFYSRQCCIFLFFSVSRLTLRPTQPPVQWALGALSLGTEWQGREADYSPPSSTNIKKGGAIPPLPHMSSWHSA
jgi:hypothetical protein